MVRSFSYFLQLADFEIKKRKVPFIPSIDFSAQSRRTIEPTKSVKFFIFTFTIFEKQEAQQHENRPIPHSGKPQSTNHNQQPTTNSALPTIINPQSTITTRQPTYNANQLTTNKKGQHRCQPTKIFQLLISELESIALRRKQILNLCTICTLEHLNISSAHFTIILTALIIL